MSKIRPINLESSFEINELFFSITDKRGVILSGNEVFARVSKYDLNQMIGKPHSLIRHPDMPRSVFRLFWREILEKRPITAYVKNMASDGSFYWVLASVFPYENEFVSLRLKPSSEHLAKVEELYKKMIHIEATKDSMDEAEKFMNDEIKKMGFSNYTSFMYSSLKKETLSRHSINKVKNLVKNKKVQTSQIVKEKTINSLNAFSNISEDNSKISQNTQVVLSSFNLIKQLSLNLSISSNHMGVQAASMATIANLFDEQSFSIKNSLQGFKEMLSTASVESILPLEYKILCANLQIEMVESFLTDGVVDGELRMDAEKVDSCNKLIHLAQTYLYDVKEKLFELRSQMRKFKDYHGEFEQLIEGLRVIMQMGKIEVSKVNGGAQAFGPQIESMSSFILTTQEPINIMSQQLLKVQSEIQKILNDLKETDQELVSLEFKNAA